MLSNKTILILSTEPWGTNFVSKHHYARYLSENNTVFFLNPASGFSKNPFGTIQCRFQQINENLQVIDYINLLPRLNNLPVFIQKMVYKKQAKQIEKAIQQQTGKQVDLIWSFDPFRYFDQAVWQAPVRIYHTVDFHPHAQHEDQIIKSSTSFFGVADLILADHAHIRKGTLVGHGADIDGFEQSDRNVSLPGTNAIRACYTGNFHKHIDYGILHQLVTENPDIDFIMIGPTAGSNLSSRNTVAQNTLEELKAQPNIHFIGAVPPKALMGYLEACQINLVLFKKGHEKIHCSPHKLMGYFYSGNVTLSNFIDAHRNTEEDIIQMIPDQADIPATFNKLKKNLNQHNTPALKEKRRAFAEANSYRQKITFIGAQLSQ